MLILASRSPQRRAILEQLGVTFTVAVSGAAELDSGDPAEVALANALRKARTVRERPEIDSAAVVLGADTVVALGSRLFGKPSDERDARAMLAALGGRTHTVVSGVAVITADGERTAVAHTEVRFRALDERTLDWYVATGEWRERAGGYAIQSAGAALVAEVHGDFTNVVGLPVATLLEMCPRLLDR